MPVPISFEIWKSKVTVINAFKQSAELKALTKAFEQYNIRKTPVRIKDLDRCFKAWNGASTAVITQEKLKLGIAVANLAYTIANVPQASSGLSQIRAMGWKHVAWTSAAYSWTTAVLATDKQGDLTSTQTIQINEAFNRAKNGARIARNELLQLTSSSFTQSTLSFTAKAYVDYFGVYDATRFKTVQKNMGFIYLAFKDAAHEPNVIDLRDTAYGKACYAACFRKDLRSAGSRMSLTGHVDIFLGRSFFVGSVGGSGGVSYGSSSDATVATLVHEFAHGAINAVDAPPVDASNNWVLTPDHLSNPSHADYGESPENSVQASTIDADKKLALKEPSIAICNADCYGQFVKDHLMRDKL